MVKQFFDRHFLLIVLLILLLFYLVSGLRLCAVESGSMEPAIPTWSLCVVSTRTDFDEIEVGDVVVYTRAFDQKKIIHRVIEITEEGMVTKGDANSIDDGLSVTRDNLFAKSLLHIPYLGKLPTLIRTPVGIAAIAVIAIILAVGEVQSGKKEKNGREKEK